MGRLNLICNGMMIINEVDDDSIDIVIPTIPGHVRKYCVDPAPSKSTVFDLPVGEYRLDGPPSSSRACRDLFDPNGCLVLSQGVVDFDANGAAAVSAVITVPKPDVVRLFRAAEPDNNSMISGPVSTSAVDVEPALLNDIAVLSYKDPPAGMTLRLGLTDHPGSLASSEAGPAETDVINWILYSNEAVGPRVGEVHETTLNNFLSIDGQQTDLGLSGFGTQDGACKTAIGMDPIHMALFHELPPPPTPGLFNSGPAGCSFVVLAE